jgi:hypothetical protein
LEMLFQQQRSERFVYTLELGIKCTVVERYLLNNVIAFDIVMGIYQVEIKYLQRFDPCELLIDYTVWIPVSNTRMTC